MITFLALVFLMSLTGCIAFRYIPELTDPAIEITDDMDTEDLI